MNTNRLKSLQVIVGNENVKNDSGTISAHAVDGVAPWAVVFPESVDQVSGIVRLAREEDLALVPHGSGSKMGKGNPPSRLDLVVSTTRLNRIVDMDTANLTATVQAGVKFKDIQAALAPLENRCYLPAGTLGTIIDQEVCSNRENTGCFIPMWPECSDSATIGGIIAANSSGPTQLIYGLPRDMVLGIRYVAPNGEIIGMGGKTVKNVSGYDICKLMIGSMGSLGMLCEMTLRLLPLPESLGTCIFTFPDLKTASDFVDRIFQTRLLPAAVELVNRRACEYLIPEQASALENTEYAVAVALEGFEEAVNRMKSETREMALESSAEKDFYLGTDAHRRFWNTYSNLVPSLSDPYPDTVSFRLNYPISGYTKVVESAESVIKQTRLDYLLLVHAGSGITMIHFPVDPGDQGVFDGLTSINKKLLGTCENIGGNMVVERAGLSLKEKLKVWGLPRTDMVIMKRIKQQIDPSGLFCPGRFVGGI
jgi:FAD/FMN-containing dehydrogenase